MREGEMGQKSFQGAGNKGANSKSKEAGLDVRTDWHPPGREEGASRYLRSMMRHGGSGGGQERPWPLGRPPEQRRRRPPCGHTAQPGEGDGHG